MVRAQEHGHNPLHEVAAAVVTGLPVELSTAKPTLDLCGDSRADFEKWLRTRHAGA
jgi:hypothetical protein